jgi:hypothetical protein
MITRLHLNITILLILVLVNFSCKKERYLPLNRPIDNSNYYLENREYFWGQSWQRMPNGYAMTLQTQMLTDSVINRGIGVGVANYSELSRFEILPFTIDDPLLPDTIQLSYTVTPGRLEVFAKTSVNITWLSDVFIQY